jgi:dephospho-CoA kinase
MARLTERKNFDKEKIQYLLSKQISVKNKNQKANFLINTDKKIMDVEQEVRKIIKFLEEKK